MTLVKGELGLALVFIALGGLWIAKGARLSLWQGFAPDSGFLPLIYGALLAALAGAALVQEVLRGGRPTSQELRKPLLVLGALVAAVAALPFAGFALCIFALLVFLYGYVERLRWRAAAMVSAAVTGALYLVFRGWLGVPLPVLFP